MSLYQFKKSVIGKADEIKIDADAMLDITKESIVTLIQPDAEFTEMDAKELLNSSLGLLKFGQWFLENHLVPFTLTYNN